MASYILAQCDGTGEFPVYQWPDAKYGTCRHCKKFIRLRADGMLRFHGKRELKWES